MTISIGDKIPSATLTQATADGPQPLSTEDLFNGKTVVLFAVPGAFTPTCHAQHLPDFLQNAGDLKSKGVDTIACLSVNDPFVMKAWADSQNVGDAVLMIADGNGDFTKALGLELDATGFGMGLRSKRFAMLVKNGEVAALNVEEGGEFKVSGAGPILSAL